LKVSGFVNDLITQTMKWDWV